MTPVVRPGRLRRKADIDKVVRFGGGAGGNHMRVAALRTGDAAAILALSVGRKAGNAVTRNRIKRRLRAAAAECELDGGFAYVVWADSEVERMNYWELLETLRSLAERATQKTERRSDLGRR